MLTLFFFAVALNFPLVNIQQVLNIGFHIVELFYFLTRRFKFIERLPQKPRPQGRPGP